MSSFVSRLTWDSVAAEAYIYIYFPLTGLEVDGKNSIELELSFSFDRAELFSSFALLKALRRK